jgi:hypothetical protein
MNNFFAAGVTPLFGLLIREWGISINQASAIPSYAVLAMGLSVSHFYHHLNLKKF